MIGKRLKHYEITGSLGEGGMGVVYRAVDTRLNRPVALKFISPQRVGSAEERRRLEHEARSAAALRHPNICTIYDIDEADGQVFISMAFLEGESVRDRVQREGRLPVDECARIVRQVADGLREAHAHGVIHRDIKSANILLTTRGEAVILDFGLAKLPAGASVTQTDAFSGTVAYAAPEQIRGDRLDARADLWSLGVVWYEMLTGALPFTGNSIAATMHAVLEQEPAPVRALRPEVPPAMERALAALLVKDAKRRTGDAASLLGVLSGATDSSVRSGAAPTVPSIAVLPFANMSADAEQAYFCDGIAEDIINDLARIRGLRVLARTTSFAYRDAGDVRELGRRIGVESVLEGSVRKAGNRLRISAQLVDVASGSPIWSERWDRDTSDVFAIQDEIARATVAALRVRLTPRDEQALAGAGTQDVQAYDLFLQGRNLVYGSARGLHQARIYLQAAVDRDPDFARAHAVLALAGVFVAQFFTHEEGLLDRSRAAAERALALDPDLAEAHAAIGQVYVLLGRHEDAEREFREAVRLNPGAYEPHYFYGRLLFIQKRWSEVPAEWERAIEVDPAEFQCACMIAAVYRELGWSEEQRRPVLERAYERVSACVAKQPDSVRAYYLGTGVLFELGRREEALAWVDRAIRVDPHDIGLHYNLACTLALAGEKERALHHLERSLELGFIGLEWLDADPDLASLRDDARYRAIVDKHRKM
jgi:TolB-like protein/thioredoxin-like negative regulator of GroEL